MPVKQIQKRPDIIIEPEENQGVFRIEMLFLLYPMFLRPSLPLQNQLEGKHFFLRTEIAETGRPSDARQRGDLRDRYLFHRLRFKQLYQRVSKALLEKCRFFGD